MPDKPNKIENAATSKLKTASENLSSEVEKDDDLDVASSKTGVHIDPQ